MLLLPLAALQRDEARWEQVGLHPIEKCNPGDYNSSMKRITFATHTPWTLTISATKQILIGLVLAVTFMVPHQTLAAGPAPIDLGSAAHFMILATATVTTTGGGHH